MSWTTISRALGGAGYALFFAAAFTPLPNLLAGWLVSPARLEQADAIVVLSAGIEPDGMLSDASLRRTVHGITLARQGLAPLLVLSGSGRDGGPTEAAVRAALAHDLGLPRERILTETGAHTTREEAARLSMALRPRGIRRILLVTGALHTARARLVFERAGFTVFPAPVEDWSHWVAYPEGRLELMRGILAEVFGTVYYRAAGYL